MTVRAKDTYRCQTIADLARQLMKYTPAEKRREEVRRAEALHDQINPDQNYPLDFIQYRITGYHNESEQEDATILVGDAILPDLRNLIDELSKSVGMPITEDDPAQTVEAVAERLGINTRTLSRWRKQGLRWRWLLLPGKTRKRVGFTPAALEHFQKNHPEQFEQATSYTRIDGAMREQILERAAKLAMARDVTLNQVAAHLAKRTGRALQTIRILLEKHEQQNPDALLFPDRSAPLTDLQKRQIYRKFRQGVGVAALCKTFGRTRSTIYRAVSQRRAAALDRLRLTFVYGEVFAKEDADQTILRPAPKIATVPTDEVSGHDLPLSIAYLYAHKSVTARQRRNLLLQYNYLKFKAARLREDRDPYSPRAHELDEIERCVRDAVKRRDLLVAMSLPIVLSVARQNLVGQPDGGPHRLIELLLIGNEVLFESVEQFDPNRMQTFSTFLTWQLQRVFAVESEDQRLTRRAHRRFDPDAALQMMRLQASRAGIHLPLNPEAMHDG